MALALHAARRGLSVVVFERRSLPADKPCGEGILPPGVRALENLGVRSVIDPQESTPLQGIRYVQEDGSAAEARFTTGPGLGVRRTELSRVLVQACRQQGVELYERTQALDHRRTAGGVAVYAGGRWIEARLLVAADGLGSPLRRAEGLDGQAPPIRRYGLRQHFRLAPWSSLVEVHFAASGEAYVTPVGPHRVGVAFLWEKGAMPPPLGFSSLLDHFPLLAERLRGAPEDSSALAAGPLWHRARARVSDRFVLLGDAAGYVDAITGEGVALALASAERLGELLPEALARGASRQTLAAYERAQAASFRRYAGVTGALLTLARRPRARRAVIRALGRHPGLFERLLSLAVE